MRTSGNRSMALSKLSWSVPTLSSCVKRVMSLWVDLFDLQGSAVSGELMEAGQVIQQPLHRPVDVPAAVIRKSLGQSCGSCCVWVHGRSVHAEQATILPLWGVMLDEVAGQDRYSIRGLHCQGSLTESLLSQARWHCPGLKQGDEGELANGSRHHYCITAKIWFLQELQHSRGRDTFAL